MPKKSLKKAFVEYCLKEKFEKNREQIKILDTLYSFHQKKKFLLDIFNKSSNKMGFYLHGEVGVGKTMILNFFYNYINIPKQRSHFNEFMISFHDFRHKHKNKSNVIEKFVKNLKKKCELIYFDEFQVTNIVDAMILGKLFEIIFKEKIKIIITSNTKPDNLYKDGLQREQFLPFIFIIKKFSIVKELYIKNDYRKSKSKNIKRFFYPLNEKTNLITNQLFREITKGKKKTSKILKVKGRLFEIKNYYEKITRFNFDRLCGTNLGAEDYIKIAETCSHILIENIPKFNDSNINKQQRFITLIDVLYEKKISLSISADVSLKKFESSIKLKDPFERTLSRIYELTI